MDRHARIDVFSVAAHRLAVRRLREQPQRLSEALGVIERWRHQAGGPQRGDAHWQEWEGLLHSGVDAVEQAALARTDHAATLRSMSPLGRFITPAERKALLLQGERSRMNREAVEHVLRASAAITKDTSFVVVGSQAVLLSHPRAPAELLESNEVDLYPAMHPEHAELIDGAIGQLSMFHDTFGYHADGVGPETAVMPPDWMDRVSLHYIGEITAICPELHDLAVSKCVAAREKDADFVRALLRHKMIEPATLLERIAALEPQRAAIDTVRAWAQRRVQEAQTA